MAAREARTTTCCNSPPSPIRTRPVVHYDQIGNGRSTHLPDKPAGFWTPGLFLDELANLLDRLGIAGDYHLFGQSWGGMLGRRARRRRPAGCAGS